MRTSPLQNKSNRALSSETMAFDRLLLSEAELRELTGTKQSARQRQWLETHGWPYLSPVGRCGYPRVSMEVFRQKTGSTRETKTSSEPNFDALDRLGKNA